MLYRRGTPTYGTLRLHASHIVQRVRCQDLGSIQHPPRRHDGAAIHAENGLEDVEDKLRL